MVYIIDVINEDNELEKYMIDLMDFKVEAEHLRQLILTVKYAFNQGNSFKSLRGEYKNFDSLDAKEKIEIIVNVLQSSLNPNICSYKYQELEKDLEMKI